jgi:hypothetical protein
MFILNKFFSHKASKKACILKVVLKYDVFKHLDMNHALKEAE